MEKPQANDPSLQSTDWIGQSRFAPTLSHRLPTSFAILVTLVLSGFLVFGQHTRTERAPGILVPAAGLIETTALNSGKVSEILVEQGQAVTQSQALIVISSEQSSITMGETNAAVTDSLELQRNRISIAIRDLQRLENQQIESAKEDIGILNFEVLQLDQQIDNQQQQYEISQTLLTDASQLIESGFVSQIEVNRMRLAVLSASFELIALQRHRLGLERELLREQGRIDQIPIEFAVRRRELEDRRDEIDQALFRNEVLRAQILTATRDGVISAIYTAVGQAVGANQALLALVPGNSALVGHVYISSRAAGLVTEGARVVIRYEAYPHQKFGLHTGRIVSMSGSARMPPQVSAELGRVVSEPMYRAEVEIDQQTIGVNGAVEQLKAGMAIEAEIQLDSRSYLRWLLGS